MVAGEPGTLLEHGTEVRDGKTYRIWKTGPIKGREEYSVGPRGELRHTHPQFRGKKKHRLAFRRKLIVALNTTTPVGYYELQPKDKLKPLDVIIDVMSGRWAVTPYIGLTVAQMRENFPGWPRAARRTPDFKCDGNHGMPFCPDPECWQGSAKQCCPRDHNHDGNCDRHPALKAA